MTSYIGVGVMSGTSLDGVDLCLVEFTGVEEQDIWSYRILRAKTVPYSKQWRDSLRGATELSGLELTRLNVSYGTLLAKTINEFIAEDSSKAPQFVACHGHTVFHQPEHNFTLQIGDGETMAASLPCVVVTNFRNKDVSLGGQGAPVVPCGEAFLFQEYAMCMNLGGIANISRNGRGWDVCVCNMMLNMLAGLSDQDLEYDQDGTLAESGEVIPELLSALNDLEYYSAEPPKSLGVEWYQAYVAPLLDNKVHTVPNLLRTAVEHIAQQLVAGMTRPLKDNTPATPGSTVAPPGDDVKPRRVLFTGGGALNKYLMATIKKHLQQQDTNIKVMECVDKDTVNYKEALIFAFLGLRTLKGLSNIYGSVTGASGNSVSGSIHLPAKSRSKSSIPFNLNKLTSLYQANCNTNGNTPTAGNDKHRKSWTLYD